MSVATLTHGQPLPGATKASRVDVVVVIGAIVLGIAVLMATIGPMLAPFPAEKLFVGEPLQGVSAAHWMGTDDLGRDIFSRVLVGARASLIGSLAVVVLSTAFGVTLALVAAWYGGWANAVVARVIDVLFVIPGIVLAILAVAMFGKGLVAPVLALSIAYAPIVARLALAVARVEFGKPYVNALWVQGASTASIIFKHALPAMFPTILAQSTLGFGYAMLDLSAISYLGLGQQPPAADWGQLIANGQASIQTGAVEQSLFAALCVVATVLAVNVLGARVASWSEEASR
jgi:ABC-type dipeptide/oligopeptide/nickel transport system permease subunit